MISAREHVRAGHRWVVDVDLESLFDRVNHDVLMARVAARTRVRIKKDSVMWSPGKPDL